MNILAGAGFAAVAAGLLYVFVDQKPADVYDMPVDQAYGLLTSVDFGESKGDVMRTSTGNGSNKVTWRTRGSHVGRACDLALAPFEGDAARTHVTVTCQGGGAGEGAAAGMAHNMHRDNVIERLDARLTGRAFDSARVGSTASRWPSDGVDGSYGTAVSKAIEMDREVREMQAESRKPRSAEEIQDAQMDAFYAGG
ncbi:hypothetical protein [Aurantiacibacter rhizosphaerae]|uniref:Uncharacterized protein n=1 Tax=Aurantiacibacter rhizosphaerae TaxID=2691582 RepID=A0A844XCX5_9SPHN|nr:hypothetical protein [Aurantiacibacter rhizosphaerae]MWV28297.1 hypothetical protein [Aurantiacibacter rhizosphaerae]